jgi:hypothetical protein
MRRMCCCIRIHVWGGGERSISSLSTKGPRRFYRVLKGVVAVLAAVSGVMAKLVMSEKGTTKSFGPLPPSSAVRKCPPPFVRGPYQEGSHFPNLFRFTLRTFNPSPSPITTNTTITCQTHTHTRTHVCPRVLCTCAAKYVYTY